MRHGLVLWLTYLMTTWLLTGCDESSPATTTPATTTPATPATTTPATTTPPESSVAASPSPDGKLLTNSVGMDLKLILAGTFMMGDNSYQSPAHQVTVTKDYYIGVYEVTQEQYEQVVGSNPSNIKGANKPVENVTWEDAVAYCEKLSALPAEQTVGRVYRLPTEAEWECACRAGTSTAFSFGDDEQDFGKYAWFDKNSGFTTQTVGEKLPNGWGLYDMHGNVWEWCSDWYGANPKSGVTDPVGPSTGSLRVIRGGSWIREAALGRAAHRAANDPSDHFDILGFRLALSFPSGQSPDAEEFKGAEPAGAGTERARQ